MRNHRRRGLRAATVAIGACLTLVGQTMPARAHTSSPLCRSSTFEGSSCSLRARVAASRATTLTPRQPGLRTLPRGTSPVTVPALVAAGTFVIAHRGAPNVYPEHTLEAYRSVIAAGARAVEPDVHLLSDGSLGVMHDPTVDRTTSSSGDTAAHTAASWSTLAVDVGRSLGGAYTSATYRPPLFDEVAREFGNSVVLVPEAKNAGSGAAIVATLKRFGIRPDAVLVQSFDARELDAANAAGFPTMLLGDALDPRAVAAAGIPWVGVSISVPSSYVTAMIAAGLRVAVHTVNRHVDSARFRALGVHGIFSDDPIYLSRTHFRTTDPYADQTWYHGHLAASPNTRGEFLAPDMWGFQSEEVQYTGALQGWASPVGNHDANDSFVIDLTVALESATRDASSWASVAITTSDRPFRNAAAVGVNGYHVLLRATGGLDIFRVADGTPTLLPSVSRGVLSPPSGLTPYRITVSSSEVTVARRDTPFEVIARDATYRGGYLHFGRHAARVRFKDVVVVDGAI